MKVLLYFTLLMLSPLVIGQDDSWRDSLDMARNAYKNKDYGKALKYYESAQRKAPDNLDLSDEMGQSAYKAREFERAEKIYQQGGGSKKNKAQRGDNFHNLGNAQIRQENYQGAIESYKKSLRINPNDDRTRYNLSEAIRRLTDQQGQNNDPNDPNDPKKNGVGQQDPGGQQSDPQNGENSGGDQGDKQESQQGESSSSGGTPKDGEGQLPNQMVERTLDNLARKEAETKRKMMGGTGGGKSSNSGKDW